MGEAIYKYKEQVVLVQKCALTGKVLMRLELEPNIVTNAGDLYYAQRGAASAPSKTFNLGMMVAARSFARSTTKAATFRDFKGIATSLSGRQLFDSGYPKTNDSDTDNTGRTADAVTYKRTYNTSQANYTIRALGICLNGAESNDSAASRVLLSYKTLSVAQQVVKTSSQTLVVYINHTFNGV